MQPQSFRKLTFALVALLVGAAILAAPTQARAELDLSWSVNTALLGSSASDTSFNINQSAGGFTVTGSAIGTASGAFGPGVAGMDLSTISVTSNGAGTLVLYLTQNNQTSPVGTGTLASTLSGHFLAGSGTASLTGYGNDNNVLYGNAAGQGGISPLVSPPNNVATPPASLSALGTTTSTTFNAISPYSMTEILTINFTGAGTVSLSSDSSTKFSVTPEPATVAMALTALPLLGIGALVRRRRRERI